MIKEIIVSYHVRVRGLPGKMKVMLPAKQFIVQHVIRFYWINVIFELVEDSILDPKRSLFW